MYTSVNLIIYLLLHTVHNHFVPLVVDMGIYIFYDAVW